MAKKNQSTKKSIKESKSRLKSKKNFSSSLRAGCGIFLPKDQPYWQQVRKVSEKAAADFGYRRIDTPIVEFTNLFTRGIGTGTDIIEKEMYSFATKGGEKVSLRPEFTAGIARSYIQNGMQVESKPVKLFYIGPCYRYDRPQEGRLSRIFSVRLRGFRRAGRDRGRADDPDGLADHFSARDQKCDRACQQHRLSAVPQTISQSSGELF